MRDESATEEIGFVRRWSYPAVFLLLVVLGWFAADWRGRSTDAERRDRLIKQAAQVSAPDVSNKSLISSRLQGG